MRMFFLRMMALVVCATAVITAQSTQNLAGQWQGTINPGKELRLVFVLTANAASGGYTASPVAAEGKLYFAGEEGDIRVIRTGPKFELLSVNPLGEPCMATPAISDGMIFIRTQHYLFGVGRKSPTPPRQ